MDVLMFMGRIASAVVFALRGVDSARELDRRCRDEIAFEWLCGGVPVNYHALNDFRSGTGNDKVMDELLSDNVATLPTATATASAARARSAIPRAEVIPTTM